MGSPGKSKGSSNAAAPAPSAAPVAPPPEGPETRTAEDVDASRRAAAASKTPEDELTGLKSKEDELTNKPKGKTLLGQ